MTVQRFEPEHVYRDETERVWPGVTSILGIVPPWLGRFDHIPADRLEFKRDLGSAVHLAIALDAEGALDDSTVSETILVNGEEKPGVLPYLRAWRRYLQEAGFTARYTEQVVWHPTYGYAGTLDALGTIGRRKVLADAKTGAEWDADLAGPQTAAYLEAARALKLDGADGVVERCSVHLRADGTYRVVPHTSRRDFHVFLAALELHNFMLRRRN